MPLNLPIPMPEHFDPQKPRGRHHPAFGYTLVTIVLLGGVVMFGFITVFIPWAVVDLAPGQRAWAYPFKTCIENTFSPVNEETCIDNDFIEPQGAPLTAGTRECKGFILATIAFVFISVLIGVILLILMVIMLLRLWSRPMKLYVVSLVLLAIVCVAAMLAWVMFICYAENECVPNSIFPVQGYSYGFIMYVFATAMALAAVITGTLGFLTLKSFKDSPENYYPSPDQGFPSFITGSPYSGQFAMNNQMMNNQMMNNLPLNSTPSFQGFL